MSDNPLVQLVNDINLPGHLVSFLKKLTGPALNEFSQYLGDNVRYWRFKNQVNILTKASQYLDKKGLSPSQVELKVLVPLLESCSLETDERLQDMWANLLANAASSENRFNSYSIYVELLKGLSTNEAHLLMWMFERVRPEFSLDQSFIRKVQINAEFTFTDVEFEILLDNLSRLRLVEIQMQSSKGGLFSGRFNKKSDFICMTRLGYEMVKKCKIVE